MMPLQGATKACVEICETTKEGKKGLLKCAVYFLGYVYIFIFNQKLDILSIPPSLYLKNRKIGFHANQSVLVCSCVKRLGTNGFKFPAKGSLPVILTSMVYSCWPRMLEE